MYQFVFLIAYNHKIYQIITCIYFTEVSNCIFWIYLKDSFSVKQRGHIWTTNKKQKKKKRGNTNVKTSLKYFFNF